MDQGNKLKAWLFVLADVIALYAGLFITIFLRYGDDFYIQFLNAHAEPFTFIFIVWILVFYIAGLYDLRKLRNSIDFLKTLFLCLGVNAALSVLIFYSIPAFGIAPKTNLFIFIVIFAILETFWRRLLNRWMTFGDAPNKILIVGTSSVAEEIKRMIRQSPQLGYEIKAEIDEKTAYASPHLLKEAIHREHINLIIVPRLLKNETKLVATLYELFGSGVLVSDTASFYEIIMRKVPLADVEETWFLENIAQEVNFYDPLKRAIEFVGALVLGIVLLPFEIIIALLVLITSRGPVIYKQVRVGQKGKNFTLYKFRTMRADAEKDGPQWSTENDARITVLGRALRKTHLDELPQLWNILAGELSFVGPRPERPEFVSQLETKIPYYEVRLFIKPGVTGWAQIHHRADLNDEDVRQKLQYDIYYLKHRSPILDVAIILKTAKSIFVSAK